ncbi:MAG TPA: hypothetical protein VHD63_27885 [Ktedonobacteraceae bacterium]|nr:hypothetical protein [Ktedonobacteraceae bacterium]
MGIIESAIIVYVNSHLIVNSLIVLNIPFSLILWIVALLVIGALASKRTGRVSTGTLTGLWTGMVGGAMTAASWFMMLVIQQSHYYYGSNVVQIVLYLTALIILFLAILGIATGLGALGGLIGQSFARATSVAYRYQQSKLPHDSVSSDPPQQEMYQYQQSHSSQRERQAE